MRVWSWSKGAIRVDGGTGFEAVFDFEDFWSAHGDAATEEIAEFIVDACNAAEQRQGRQPTDPRDGQLWGTGATLAHVDKIAEKP